MGLRLPRRSMKNGSATIGAVGTLLAAGTAAYGQTVRTENVLPAATDPAINGWLAAHGTAFAPSVVRREQLMLFLHGQGGSGTGAMELLRTAAEMGYHAVGLTYPNDWSPFNLCSGGGDPECAEKIRLELLDGTDRTPLISVTRVNSVENRLIKLLAFLHAAHPGEGWGQYVDDATGTIRWDQVAVWGHSQGGGNAGVLARAHALARACTSAPAADGGTGSPAAWWAPHQTPTSNYFGFCHAQDALSTKVAFWNALGMGALGAVTDVATSAPPFAGTHELSSSVAPAVAGQFHNSVVIDSVTPRVGGVVGGVPVYKPVWQYMLGADTAPPAGGRVWDDVVFATEAGTAGPVALRMDIYEATSGAGPRPLVVWIHGGGWQSGSHNQVPTFVLALRARGCTVASIGYRLTGEAIFPAQIHDCKGAIRFLRANAATFGIDANRVGVWGSSAGAHLAALVTTSGGVPDLDGLTGGNNGFSSRVIAGVSFFAPTDILHMQDDCAAQAPGCSFNHDDPSSPESKLLGVGGTGQGLAWLRANQNNPSAPFPQLIATARSVDPITHVQAGDPPMYIAHGDQDATVPISQSTKLRDALMRAGVEHVFVSVPGAGHGSLGSTVELAAADWLIARLLSDLPCNPPCPADLDCSGSLDPDDLADFITCFFAEAPACAAADFNRDARTDPDDLADYITAFFAGCS